MANIFTNEVLVLLAAPVRLDTGLALRSGVEVQNNGPNPIWLAFNDSASCVLNKCRKVSPGEAFSVAVPSQVPIWAIAATADQLTGAATCVTEIQ